MSSELKRTKVKSLVPLDPAALSQTPGICRCFRYAFWATEREGTSLSRVQTRARSIMLHVVFRFTSEDDLQPTLTAALLADRPGQQLQFTEEETERITREVWRRLKQGLLIDECPGWLALPVPLSALAEGDDPKLPARLAA